MKLKILDLCGRKMWKVVIKKMIFHDKLKPSKSRFSETSKLFSRASNQSETPLNFPIHSKFSNRLIRTLPVLNHSQVLSYSSLLNNQRFTETPYQNSKKNTIISYKFYSKINESRQNVIYFNNIEFNQDYKVLRLNRKLKKPLRRIYKHKKLQDLNLIISSTPNLKH